MVLIGWLVNNIKKLTSPSNIFYRNPTHCRISGFIVPVLLITFIFSATASSQQLTGKELFVGNRCVNCHTLGRGRYVGPDLYKIDQRYTKQEIINWMVNSQQIYQQKGKAPLNEGYPPMPPMNVPADQAEKIYDYLVKFQIFNDRQEEGSIKGVIVNKTLNQNIAGQDIKLTSYVGDKSREQYSVKSDSKGQYLFENLGWDRSYVVSLMFNGVEYATGKLVFTPEESVKTLDLPVFDVSTDGSLISLDSSHVIIEIQGETASFAEMFVFNNGSNSVFVGKDINSDQKETLSFDIPAGANTLQFHHGMSEETSILKDGKLISTQAVQPGLTRIIFSYQIPIDRHTEINRKSNYLINSQLIMVSDNGYEMDIQGLQRGEQVDMHNKKFIKWSGNNLQKGHDIKISISKPIVVTDYAKWIVLIIVVLLIAGSIGYSFLRKNKTQTQTSSDDESLESLKDSLIRDIARLDDMFEANDIGQQEYQKLRDEKKKKLLEIVETSK